MTPTTDIDNLTRLYSPVITYDPTGNPRIILRKTKQLYHRRGTSYYAWLVLLEKVIDSTPTRAYSWIEEIDKEEVDPILKQLKEEERKKKELLKPKPTPKPKKKLYYRPPKVKIKIIKPKPTPLTPEEKKLRQKEARKRFNERHRDKINAWHKQYYEKHKEEIKQKKRSYCKEYYQAHKEELNKRTLERYHRKKNQNIPPDQTITPTRDTLLDEG